jgi:hypothetical protein
MSTVPSLYLVMCGSLLLFCLPHTPIKVALRCASKGQEGPARVCGRTHHQGVAQGTLACAFCSYLFRCLPISLLCRCLFLSLSLSLSPSVSLFLSLVLSFFLASSPALLVLLHSTAPTLPYHRSTRSRMPAMLPRCSKPVCSSFSSRNIRIADLKLVPLTPSPNPLLCLLYVLPGVSLRC